MNETLTPIPQRFAVVRDAADIVTTIERYMYGNYVATAVGTDVVIAGADFAGFTMEAIIDRLGSGMHVAEELVSTRERLRA